MYGKSSLFGLVSLLALVLTSIDAATTTGCYPAGAVSEILGDTLTLQRTDVFSPSECIVSWILDNV